MLQNTWTEIELLPGYFSCHQGCPHLHLLRWIVVGKNLREFYFVMVEAGCLYNENISTRK